MWFTLVFYNLETGCTLNWQTHWSLAFAFNFVVWKEKWKRVAWTFFWDHLMFLSRRKQVIQRFLKTWRWISDKTIELLLFRRSKKKALPVSFWQVPFVCDHHFGDPFCCQRGWWEHLDRNASPLVSTFLEYSLWCI